MAALRDVMAWIIKNYPHQGELSNARLTKMVYLSDWHHTVYSNARMTEIDWFFDNHGPFVWDVKNKAAEEREWFRIVETKNMYGSRKTLIELRDRDVAEIEISESEKDSISKMIERTKGLYWDDFITFVYSTFPVLVSEKYSQLDLEALAEKFRAEKGIEVAA